MDGGFSKNLLILDENTITISPFSGESDICPLDSTYNAYKINFSNTSISLSLGRLGPAGLRRNEVRKLDRKC